MSVIFNGVTIETLVHNGVDIGSLQFNGVEVFDGGLSFPARFAFVINQDHILHLVDREGVGLIYTLDTDTSTVTLRYTAPIGHLIVGLVWDGTNYYALQAAIDTNRPIGGSGHDYTILRSTDIGLTWDIVHTFEAADTSLLGGGDLVAINSGHIIVWYTNKPYTVFYVDKIYSYVSTDSGVSWAWSGTADTTNPTVRSATAKIGVNSSLIGCGNGYENDTIKNKIAIRLGNGAELLNSLDGTLGLLYEGVQDYNLSGQDLVLAKVMNTDFTNQSLRSYDPNLSLISEKIIQQATSISKSMVNHNLEAFYFGANHQIWKYNGTSTELVRSLNNSALNIISVFAQDRIIIGIGTNEIVPGTFEAIFTWTGGDTWFSQTINGVPGTYGLDALRIAGSAEPPPPPTTPNWSFVPDQNTHEDNLPIQLDMNAYVWSAIEITGWQVTGGGQIDGNGILTITTGDSGTLALQVTAINGIGSSSSNGFNWVIFVNEDPVIDQQPITVTVDEGDGGIFVVVASHPQNEELFYQWFADTGSGYSEAQLALTNVSGHNSTTLSINTSDLTDNANIVCRVRAYDANSVNNETFTVPVPLIVNEIAVPQPPFWFTVPDGLIHDSGLPVDIDMNSFVVSELPLYNWTLISEPAGVTISTAGIVTIANTTAIGTYPMSCSVTNDAGIESSNIFSWEITNVYIPAPPVWDTIPSQTNEIMDQPISLDMNSFVTSLLPVSWNTNIGFIGVDGVLVLSGVGADTIPGIIVTATNDDGSTQSDPFSWLITRSTIVNDDFNRADGPLGDDWIAVERGMDVFELGCADTVVGDLDVALSVNVGIIPNQYNVHTVLEIRKPPTGFSYFIASISADNLSGVNDGIIIKVIANNLTIEDGLNNLIYEVGNIPSPTIIDIEHEELNITIRINGTPAYVGPVVSSREGIIFLMGYTLVDVSSIGIFESIFVEVY